MKTLPFVLLLASLLFLATPAQAANYTCAVEQNDCNFELQEGDSVQFWSGFQAQALNVELGRAYLRFIDPYGNYAASLELKDGETDTALGALMRATVLRTRMMNDTFGSVNVTFHPLKPNLKVEAIIKQANEWPVVQRGGMILVQDYVKNLTVINDGETPIGTFRFSFVLEQDGELVGYPIEETINGTQPGLSSYPSFDGVGWSTSVLPKLMPAAFKIRIIVDRPNFLVESNENDNEIDITVEVTAATATPTPSIAPTATATPAPTATPLPTQLATSTPTALPTATSEPTIVPGLPVEGRLLLAVLIVVALALAILYFTQSRAAPAAPAPKKRK